MSEYQYYEWQTIDRPLTEEEQAEVEQLSSRIEVTPTRVFVEYHCSDFRHDPREVLARYAYLPRLQNQAFTQRTVRQLLDEAGRTQG